MPPLENHRWELFAQNLSKGMTSTDAYEAAGYKPSRANASVLKTNQSIIARVLELQGKNNDRLVISRQYVVDALLENAEKALGRKPVKVGKLGEVVEVYVYKGDVANAAIKMAGAELGMFIDRKEFKHSVGEFDKMSDAELVQLLAQEAQQLLIEDHSGDDE